MSAAGLVDSAGAPRPQGVNPVRAAAAFWGAVVFLPVGMNYLALVLLVLAILARAVLASDVETSLAARWRRVRSHPLCWPIAFLLGWSALVLVLGPRYPETASNAFHVVRIAATLALALSLTRQEAVAALGAFALALAASASVVAIHQLIGLPDLRVGPGLDVWSNLLRADLGNKAISNAVLFALAGSAALAIALDAGGARRAIAIAAFVAAFAIVGWALPSRTGVMILLLAMPLVLIDRWRASARHALAAALASLLLGAALLGAVPAARERLAQGWSEMTAAIAGDVSPTSWGLRLNLYRHTAAMVVERPLLGWGLGGWTSQWRARAPQGMSESNMPHNDFLWMGAQAGVVGMLAVAMLVLACARRAAARGDAVGRLGIVAIAAWLVAISANSAMRDAVIGLSMLWIVGLLLRLLTESRGTLPGWLEPGAR